MMSETGFEHGYELGLINDKVLFGFSVSEAPPFKPDDTQALGALIMTREQIEWLRLVIEHAEAHDLFNREGLARNYHLLQPLEDLQKLLTVVKVEKR